MHITYNYYAKNVKRRKKLNEQKHDTKKKTMPSTHTYIYTGTHALNGTLNSKYTKKTT